MYYVLMLSRFHLFAMIITGLLLVTACASDESKAPTPEAVIAQQAFEQALQIREAFLDDDKSSLKDLCTEDIYQKLTETIGSFRDLSLEFTMRWVDIDEEGTIHLYVAWKRKGEINGKDAAASGMAAFVLKGSPMILTEIHRESPFE